MAATARKMKPAGAPKVSPKVSAGLTWDDVEAAAEIYWAGLGGAVVRQMREWNDELFEGKIAPAPVILGRPSSIHGHIFPSLDLSCDPRRGFEATRIFTDQFGYTPPPPLRKIQRSDLLRYLMREYLRATGQDTKVGKPEWCRLVMKLHDKLSGERVWAAQAREIFRDVTDPKAKRSLTRRVRLIEQDKDPETGGASLPFARVKAWPKGTLDLGDIVREDA